MTAVTTEVSAASNTTDVLRILVGDDQADVLEALRLLLKSAGHRALKGWICSPVSRRSTMPRPSW